MLERNDVTKIQRWLRKNFPGCYLIKLESPSTSGILDMYFAWQGRNIWFEVKKPEYRFRTWKNKKIQAWHRDQMRKNGVEAYFVFTLDDVERIMAPVLNVKLGFPFNSKISYNYVYVPGND